MRLQSVFLLFAAAMSAAGQTTIQAGNQRVDFTGAVETRVFRSGTALPSTCRKGAVFFKNDAPAGRNIYLCTDMNTWTQAASGVTVTTVNNLPPASQVGLAIVTDASNPGSCSAGGGANVVLCVSNGSSWAPVGGGVTNHAALSNLDFSNSGHTGFASSTHNHDGVYAPVGHNHDGVYAPVGHNHDGVYQPVLGFTPENAANKGAPNGYAPLNAGKVPLANLPLMVGDSGSGGQAGLVPAPGAGDASNCLKGDGTWSACGGGGGGLGTDSVGTNELNDGTDTPAAGEFVRVDSTTQKFVYDSPAQVLAAIGAAPASHNHDGVYQPLLGFTPENAANKGASNGYAPLSSGLVPRAHLPIMVGATGNSAGQIGAVPAPQAGQQSLCLKGDGTWGTCGGGGSGIQIADEGAALPQRATLNFVGAGIACADDSANNRTNCSVSGGGSGGSGPAGPITASSDPLYNGERALAAGNGIRLIDSGPNGTMTVEADPSYVATQTGNNTLTGSNIVNIQRLTVQFPNAAAGTTQYYLVELTGNPSQVTNATASSDKHIGICVLGCGNTGSATIAIGGIASCVFDGATTAGNFVKSSTTAGRCTDAGPTRPSSGLVGRVLSTNPAAGTYDVLLTVR
jgi:hypothetical protein